MDPKEFRFTPEGYITKRFGEIEFTDWIDESMAWKRTCSIGDWSWIWERRFKGPDAARLISGTVINSFAKFDILQSKHATHCNEEGKVIAEGILTRLAEDEFVLMGRGSFWVDHVLRTGDYDVESTHEDWYNLQVQGPNALPLLEKLSGSNLRNTKFMHNAEIEIAGHRLLALRQGMSGEPGFELQGPREHQEEVYAEIVRVGQEFGLRKLGGRASNTGHLEACFPTIGLDYLPAIFGDDMKGYREGFLSSMPGFAAKFAVGGSFEGSDVTDWYRSPIELGWGKNIKFDHDFIGRSALEKELASPRRVIRTLVWDADDVLDVYSSMFRQGDPYHFMEMPREQRAVMTADKVLKNGREVGVATSRGYSYHSREMLSLVVIEPEFAELGTEVSVVWGNPGEIQKHIKAIVAPAPYRDNRRVDLNKLYADSPVLAAQL
ncbi:glycine cleavage system protein T [Paenarthrobacter ureafaciens]|uniref:aminomethyl transferase family protein n=1 Tax=Paenarthrobacter TaxID=1742992 RepID=UPI0015BB17E7|nr:MULTISPECIES: aminomethyl transferase family protein [Paenarthrobacter]NWL10389.1 glycine cleavage system protein T [Paenarthrobacter nitroguajacolicus]NWL26711.1 glycine cleavage system protein T [Paenarthrobacter ureafaciens]NWL32020.1 glycine cleavage system protein T [Paenarthrobacter nitroguajacolicus]